MTIHLEAPEHDSDVESALIAIALPEDRGDHPVAYESRSPKVDKWEFEARVRAAVRELVHQTEPRPQ